MKLATIAAVIGLSIITSDLDGQTENQPRGNDEAPRCQAECRHLEAHDVEREDEYFWMKDRENPDVVAYLTAENDYTQQVMADTKEFEQRVFEETKARIKQDDSSVPTQIEDTSTTHDLRKANSMRSSAAGRTRMGPPSRSCWM